MKILILASKLRNFFNFRPLTLLELMQLLLQSIINTFKEPNFKDANLSSPNQIMRFIYILALHSNLYLSYPHSKDSSNNCNNIYINIQRSKLSKQSKQRAMGGNTNLKPIVSKTFCSSSDIMLMVRKRPQVINGGGFVVMNLSQKVVFSVDGCGIIGSKGELIVRDGDGSSTLFIHKKVHIYIYMFFSRLRFNVHLKVHNLITIL